MAQMTRRLARGAAMATILALAACGAATPVPTGPATVAGTGGLNHPDIATVPGTPNNLLSPTN